MPASAEVTADPTRVLLVEDHRMFAELLCQALAEHRDLVVTGCAVDGSDALEQAAADPPDVVVLDYRLPGDDGVAVAARLRDVVPDARVLMLTGHDDDHVAHAAVAAGCAGFMTKDRATVELVDAIRAVRDGHVVLEPERMGRLATTGGLPPGRRPDTLTPRERQVLQLLAEGCSTRQIAERLFVSLNTARNHSQHLLRKLDAHSRLEAVAVGIRAGLVERAPA